MLREKRSFGYRYLRIPPFRGTLAKGGGWIMMEVSLIEVGRPWRSLGISKIFLKFLVDHSLKEGMVFYLVEYSWSLTIDALLIRTE